MSINSVNGVSAPAVEVELRQPSPPPVDSTYGLYVTIGGREYRIPDASLTEDMKEALDKLRTTGQSYDLNLCTIIHVDGTSQSVGSDHKEIEHLRNLVNRLYQSTETSIAWPIYEGNKRAPEHCSVASIPHGVKGNKHSCTDTLPSAAQAVMEGLDWVAIDFHTDRARKCLRWEEFEPKENQRTPDAYRDAVQQLFKSRKAAALEATKQHFPLGGLSDKAKSQVKAAHEQYATELAMMAFDGKRELYRFACHVTGVDMTQESNASAWIELEAALKEVEMNEDVIIKSPCFHRLFGRLSGLDQRATVTALKQKIPVASSRSDVDDDESEAEVSVSGSEDSDAVSDNASHHLSSAHLSVASDNEEEA